MDAVKFTRAAMRMCNDYYSKCWSCPAGDREKLMHYTNDLGDVDLKQEAIATIEHIAQYMDEDELLHHSRPLAIAYLALTEDAAVSVVRCKDRKHRIYKDMGEEIGEIGGCGLFNCAMPNEGFCSLGERKDGGDG